MNPLEPEFNEKSEEYGCGCEFDYIEWRPEEWENYAGCYCPFAEKLLEREYRERYRSGGPTSKGGLPRHQYAYRKLMQLHLANQSLTVKHY